MVTRVAFATTLEPAASENAAQVRPPTRRAGSADRCPTSFLRFRRPSENTGSFDAHVGIRSQPVVSEARAPELSPHSWEVSALVDVVVSATSRLNRPQTCRGK